MILFFNFMLTPCGKHSRFGNGYLYDAAPKEKVPSYLEFFRQPDL